MFVQIVCRRCHVGARRLSQNRSESIVDALVACVLLKRAHKRRLLLEKLLEYVWRQQQQRFDGTRQRHLQNARTTFERLEHFSRNVSLSLSLSLSFYLLVVVGTTTLRAPCSISQSRPRDAYHAKSISESAPAARSCRRSESALCGAPTPASQCAAAN